MGPEIILILLGWAIAGGSPGPATLAISGTSMGQGRRSGLLVATGILCGSASWGIAAGLGVSAIMIANVWLFEVIRYLGAAYLLFLAVKSLRSAAYPKRSSKAGPIHSGRLFLRGLLLHLTNPKAVLSWGSIYAIALPSGAGPVAVWSLFGLLFCTSMIVFWGYALLFSTPKIAMAYGRMRRWFDLAFGLLFGAASLKLLTARLT